LELALFSTFSFKHQNSAGLQMTHPNYPDWSITKRLLIDDYPLLLIEKDDQRIVLSDGAYKNLIEFLLNVSKPHTSSPENVNFIMHQGFMSGAGWAISGVFYGQLIEPFEFGEFQSDPDFTTELEKYRIRTGQVLVEPVWHVSVSSGDWRNVATYIPQSSIQKIIEVEAQLLSAEIILLEGVQVLSEDDWDLRFGWAASTGLCPSVLLLLEACATDYLQALKGGLSNLEAARAKLLDALARAELLNREFESDGVYYQLKETGCVNLKTCLDNAEYLYGYLISDARLEEFGLPEEDDVRDSIVSLDWMIQSNSMSYHFFAAAEQFFLAAAPQNLKPLIFESMRLHLVMDGGVIKLGQVERKS
jgi:hypothetical protein